MKRKWAYLGALFPLSTAAAAWAAGSGVGLDDSAGKFARSKNSQDEAHDKLPDKPDSPDAEGGPGVRTPSAGSNGDEVALRDQLDDSSDQLGDTVANVKIAPPPGNDGMYAPTGDGNTSAWQGGGAGAASPMSIASVTTPTTETPTETTPDPTSPVPTEPVDIQLSDEDSMLVLLAGDATATGEGAITSGEAVFDIVDYGVVTIGYGYATFSATGTETAEADTYVSVAGADLVFTYTTEESEGGTASSSTHVLAIDFEGDADESDLAGLNWMELLAQGPFAQWMGYEEDGDVTFDGNASMFSVAGNATDGEAPIAWTFITQAVEDAGSIVLTSIVDDEAALLMHGEAHGIDTFTSADGFIEIEDHFSTIGAVVIGVA